MGNKKKDCKKNNDIIEITNREDYYKEISKRVNGYKQNNEFVEAYKTALETRNFEIEMYWNRGSYYWTMIGAAFAAYFIVAAINQGEPAFPGFYKGIIGLFGLVTSYAWHIASRGSKFWQEN